MRSTVAACFSVRTASNTSTSSVFSYTGAPTGAALWPLGAAMAVGAAARDGPAAPFSWNGQPTANQCQLPHATPNHIGVGMRMLLSLHHQRRAFCGFLATFTGPDSPSTTTSFGPVLCGCMFRHLSWNVGDSSRVSAMCGWPDGWVHACA